MYTSILQRFGNTQVTYRIVCSNLFKVSVYLNIVRIHTVICEISEIYTCINVIVTEFSTAIVDKHCETGEDQFHILMIILVYIQFGQSRFGSLGIK